MQNRYIGSVLLISTVGYAIMRETERLEDRRNALKEYQLCQQYRANREKNELNDLVKEKSLCVEYNKSVMQPALKTLEICRKWTCTECQTAIDIVPFLERYAKIKAVEEKQVVGITSDEDLKDFKEIENYRRNEIDFWLNKVKQEGLQLNLLLYPGNNELKFFSTFHWSVYMVINKCAYDKDFVGGEPYTYKWVEETICDTDETKEYIKTYRDTIKKEFSRIQKKIF